MTELKKITEPLYSPNRKDLDLIEKAFNFARQAHEGHTRYSGEPYFVHLVETAKTLAETGMSATVIAAGLLHDTIEDVDVKPETIEKEFGPEVLFLVEGVTKLGKVRYRGMDRHNESLRKLMVAISQDIRVIIIRLADRLHNLQTLEYVPKEKQKRIATETLEIYSPIAYRLGIRRFSRELEDLCFPYVYPKQYQEIQELVKEVRRRNELSLDKFHRSVRKTLAKEGVKVVKSDYRIKGLYSLYQKYLRKDKDIDKIYDISALRIIVPDLTDCYQTLGIIHTHWRPLPNRIKDYIAVPKPNGYRSLHTTVFVGDGTVSELQIKTEKMHHEAEYGIASHIIYKNNVNQQENISWIWHLLPHKSVKPSSKNSKDLREAKYQDVPRWIKELVEYQEQVHSGKKEFMDNLKADFFQQRIFVFTPNGDVVDLPSGATPIDFAYAIHSDLGNHLFGAKVNHKLVTLGTELKNGDQVEIQTKKASQPTEKWLNYAVTALAKRKIRSHLHKQKKGSPHQSAQTRKRKPNSNKNPT